MKFLKILLYIIVALVVIIVAVNAFLPGTYTVEKSVVIDAKAVDVFEQVNNFKNWKKWSPWSKMDPDMKVEFSGPLSGTGATMSWVSEDQNVGVGEQKIVESIQNKSIRTEITFAEWNPVKANWKFEEKDGKTTVTWDLAGETDFFMRWMGLIIGPILEQNYENGLNDIKAVVETRPEQPKGVTYSVIMTKDLDYLYLNYTVENPMENPDVKGIFANAYMKIYALIGEKGLVTTGPPLVVTNKWDLENNIWDFNAGIPVGMAGIKFPGDIQTGRIPAGRALKTQYKGSYEKLQMVYDAIMKYVEYNGFEIAGPSWEQYLNKPDEVIPEELLTDIYFPIK
jgi:effector-binding domain-containing protein/ribosome-associated toxin RatA of RatAB toxin-antitoxin module